MDLTLTPEQIDFFHANGYLTLPAIIGADELEPIRAHYDRIFRERIGWDDGRMFDLGGVEGDNDPVMPQILGPTEYVPELDDFSYGANARRIAEQLYPDIEPEWNGEHMIYKPAGYGAPTPWHQDQAYHSPNFIAHGVNIWMPLDDATEANGCLHFVPGSHKLDVLPHHSANHDDRVHALEVDDPEVHCANSVAAPVPAGGCTIHAAFMLHYANANTSNRPRRAWIKTHRCPAIRRETPIDNYWVQNRRTGKMEREAVARAGAERGEAEGY